MKKLFYVYPPGARGNFLNAFLTDSIDEPAFEFAPTWSIHTCQLQELDIASKKQCTKIFINLDRPKLDRWLYAFYKKNIFLEDSSYGNILEEHSFDKLYRSVICELDLCKNVDHDMFDYVVPFSKLYDWDYMNNLKFKISGTYSNKKDIVDKSNHLNDVDNIHFKTIVDLAVNIDPNEIISYKLYDRYLEIVK